MESFLSRYKSAASEPTLRDLEVAIADYRRDTENDALAPSSGAVWYWVEELRVNSDRIQWFTQNAIRNRTGDARDVLAYAATKGRHDFAQIHGLLESRKIQLFSEEATQRIMRDSWRSALICLARYLYSAPRDEMDWLDSLTLYSLVHERRGIKSVRTTDRAYYGDLLIWRNRFEEAREVLEAEDFEPQHDYSQRLLALNAMNPSLPSNAAASDWWERFNTLLLGGGAGELPAGSSDLSFFNLPTELAETCTGVTDGPLVSVIMPIFEPSAATDVAVASLLGQTWQNLEIIMIDDASPVAAEDGTPTDYRERLERLAAQDDRIRLIFNAENRGSYSVRNEALDLACGEFVTVADKDDWHHPQRIEIQARQLMEDPELMANETNWARVDEHLKLIMRSATGRVVYPSLPSLMFRREPVLRDLGYWDTVRKSGDSEFKSRLENYYGFKVEPVIAAPLAFALMEGQNLTANDMGAGYLAPDRRAYLRAYKRWHRSIREEDASPFMPKAVEERRFVAPPAYLPQRTDEVLSYDVVFASEFGFLAGNSTSLFNEISVCLKAGLRVGVIPLQNGLIPSAAKRQFNQKMDGLIFSGQVDRLSLDVEAETDLLVIRWPTAVQNVRDTPAAVKAERVVVVSNHPPYEPSGERRSYDMGVVTRNVERLFGKRPLWAPQSEQIGAMLEPLLPASELADFSWKGIISLKEEHVSRNRFDASRRPVIGRHARDDAAKWPSNREVFRQVYPMDGSADVCILGGARVPAKKGYLPRSTENWEVFVFNEIEVEQYLSEKIDFFVYFHSDGWLEAFGMAILEAMSYGVVCVLPRHFEPVFGEAAVYAEPGDVQATLGRLWNADRYNEQQQRARRFIEEQCTPEAYVRRLQRLGVTSRNG
ncbi:glycosyltransferase [Nesterenkonia populi]